MRRRSRLLTRRALERVSHAEKSHVRYEPMLAAGHPSVRRCPTSVQCCGRAHNRLHRASETRATPKRQYHARLTSQEYYPAFSRQQRRCLYDAQARAHPQIHPSAVRACCGSLLVVYFHAQMMLATRARHAVAAASYSRQSPQLAQTPGAPALPQALAGPQSGLALALAPANAARVGSLRGFYCRAQKGRQLARRSTKWPAAFLPTLHSSCSMHGLVHGSMTSAG